MAFSIDRERRMNRSIIRPVAATLVMLLAPQLCTSEPALQSAAGAALYLEWERDHASRPLSATLHLRPGSVQIFRPGGVRRQIPMPAGSQRIVEVALSPGDSLVALALKGQVVVTSTAGAVRTQVQGAITFAWCPDAPLLAVVLGRDMPDEAAEPTGLSVWSATSGRRSTFPLFPREVAWLSADTIIYSYWSEIHELSLRDGRDRRSAHRGFLVSPDRRYSLNISPEG